MGMAPPRVAAATVVPEPFNGTATVARVRASDTIGMTYVIPYVETSGSTVSVDWGDGSATTVANGAAGDVFSASSRKLVHTYARKGTYRVSIDPSATYIAFGRVGDDRVLPLEAVERWGSAAFSAAPTVDALACEQDGASVFCGCSRLMRIAPRPFHTVPPLAFSGASSITDPAPVVGSGTLVSARAFKGSSVTGTSWWPQAVLAVPDNCFEGCTSLVSLSGLSHVTSVGDQAFRGCTSLVTLSQLLSCLSLGEAAFKDCTALAEISGLDEFGVPWSADSPDPVEKAIPVTSIRALCFDGCTSIRSLVSYPPGAVVIPRQCFRNCTGLDELNIPGHVREIHLCAFERTVAADRNVSVIRFGEPAIVHNGVTRRAATQVAALDRIDKLAFGFCTASRGDLYATQFTQGQLVDVPGYGVDDVLGGNAPSQGCTVQCQHDVKWDTGSSGEQYWFGFVNPTGQGPWGLPRLRLSSEPASAYYYSTSWVIHAANGTTWYPVDLVGSTFNSNAVPVNLGAHPSGSSDTSSRLRRLDTKDSGLWVSYNFSPESTVEARWFQ